jgi:proton-dependent oligopeptide transporter, POT family
MTSSTRTASDTLLGHPIALWNLFGTEFWERFMYYGMRAILAVHVAAAFFAHLGDNAAAEASKTYGGYTAMVYMTGILGGYVADRMLGYQRSIMLGGVLMAIGMFLLMSPDLTSFLIGLAVVVVGNGLFKPNISTMVGKLYAPGDPRRDSAFTIFYMGINAGALVAPIVCGSIIGAVYGYRWGFFTAGIGMILGLAMFQLFKHWLGQVGTAPANRDGRKTMSRLSSAAPCWSCPCTSCCPERPAGRPADRDDGRARRLVHLERDPERPEGAAAPLHRDDDPVRGQHPVLGAVRAGRVVAQLPGARLRQHADGFGTEVHFTVFQSVNPVFIILLAPVFAAMWPALDRASFNPSIPRKFGYGLIGAAVGFYVLVFAIDHAVGANGKISWVWLTLTYLIHTMGELCLSPIGLAMVTKLARPEETGLAMGGWFLSIAMANFVAGRIAAIATAAAATARRPARWRSTPKSSASCSGSAS